MLLAGWIVWVALAAYVVSLVLAKVRHHNGGVRFLAGRAAVLLSLLLALSIALPFPKVHLLWLAVVVYVLSMTWNGMVIDARVKRIPKRAEAESSRTGEPTQAIIDRELARYGYGADDTQDAML